HAEYRKLLTLRAFYAIPLTGLVVTAAFAVYLAGWYAKPGDLHDPRFLVTQVAGPLGIVAIFGTLVGILVMSHEYRYRTIGYALVAAGRRSDVLVAKIAVVTGFAMVFTAAVD